jgi:CRP-like cAMP-binding protein
MGVQAHTSRLSDLIMSEGRIIKLPKGEVIQSTDNSNRVCLIKNGFVKKYLILNDGTIRVQIVYGPKDIFPLSAAFKALFDQDLYDGPEVYYYETLCETEMLALDKNKLVELAKEHPYIYKDLLSESGRRLYFNIMMLENLGLPNSYKRVAHQIAFLAREYGDRRMLGTKIKIPLTQQDIADILSITRETVSLCMTQLKNRKLIRSGRYIFVSDVKKLENEAYS